MKAIEIELELLLVLLASTAPVEGDVFEFGVYRGTKFVPLAKATAKVCHAVDSFVGMPVPGPEDGDYYPEGKFNVGGTQRLEKRTAGMENVRIHQGYVPDVLDELSGPVSFAHVDLDHNKLTAAAMDWVWDRLSPRGLMVCHDYFLPQFEGRPAALAINDWIARTQVSPVAMQDLHIWFQKAETS